MDYILIKNGKNHYKILLSDISHIESSNKKVIIYISDKDNGGGMIECYQKISDIEEKLGATFFRCHRCYIANMKYIVSYNSSTVKMKNDKEIPLAQKKYSQFVKAFSMFSTSA